MAGKGGGAWKVAYADFVTAMMAFFLVMWITAQSKPVKQAIAQYFNEPWASSGSSTGLSSGPSGGTSLLPSAGSSLMPSDKPGDGSGKKRAESGPATRGRVPGEAGSKSPPDAEFKTLGLRKPSLAVLHDGDRRMEGCLVRFAEDSADLSEDGKEQLKRLVPLLVGKRTKIELRGHATRRPPPPGSPYQDSWQLSYARCLATLRYLEQQGIEPERLRLSQAGAYEPQTIGAEPDGQATNSRVEVYVLDEIAEDLIGTRKERAERVSTP